MIAFILKSSLALIVFFGLYWFLLRKEKLFVFNRFFLLASLYFSLSVPFITIPLNLQDSPRINNIIPSFDDVVPAVFNTGGSVTGGPVLSQPSSTGPSLAVVISTMLLIIYFSGLILFLTRFLKNLFLVIRRIRLSEKINFRKYRIVLTDDAAGPFCFFNSIFLNREDYLNERIDKELLEHEVEHARQLHSIDILLVELVKIFYWFNPVYILYDRAIRINHEYLADNRILSSTSDIRNYAGKLLDFASGRNSMPLTSGSNHSFTKKRLLMMSKAKSRGYVYSLRIITALILVLAFSILMSFKRSDLRQLNQEIKQEYKDILQNGATGPVPGKEENIPFLATFGKDAPSSFGDDDFNQVWFFSVPANMTQQFYIRVFDPDCGGEHDDMQGEFSTTTRFSIYGGKGVLPVGKDGQGQLPKGNNYKDGTLLAVKDFSVGPGFDNDYYTFGPFNPEAGELSRDGNSYLIKVVCEGISGDDGNLYRYFMSSDPTSNIPVEGGNAFTYEYTFRLWNDFSSVSHIYIYVDTAIAWIKQRNFDWDDDGQILVVSGNSQGVQVSVSGQDSWAESRIAIEPSEIGRGLDFQFHKKQGELIKNNNVTIYIENQHEEVLPIFNTPVKGF